ncbi:MAG: sialidase family protein [Bacteroidota bacterium]
MILLFSGMLLSAQPFNSFYIKTISDSTVFPSGTFAACHASTIVETEPGNFIAAWFAGSYEGAADVGIWISHFKDQKWSAPIEIVTGKDSLNKQMPCWNPVLFKTSENQLLLFYKVGKNPREWWGMLIRSTDFGKTWSEPEALPKNFLGPIKNKPIQILNGNIICPSSVESIDAKEWTVHIEITDKNLSTWEKVEIRADSGVGVIQPTILTHPNGKLQLLCRSRQGVIYQSWSDDNGLHWTKLSKTTIPNPNSGIDAVTLEDGSFILVYNSLLQGKDWFYGRNVLNVAISDDGENWKDIYQLENEKEGEFSYPAIIQASDKSIHITYTWLRKSIKHFVIVLRRI